MALNSGLWLPREKPDYPELDPLDSINFGLVGAWLLGDGRGNGVRDLSPYKNHGVLTNFGSSYPWVPGVRGGQGLNFASASSQYAAISAFRGGLLFQGALTVVLRISPVSVTVGRQLALSLVLDDTGGAGNSLDIEFNTGNVLNVAKWGGTALATSSVTPVAGASTHVAYTQDAGTSNTIYVNGVSTGTSTTARGTGAPAILRLASFNAAFPTPYWNGGLEDVRIYNRCLSATEIARLYQEPWAGLLQDDTPPYRIAAAGGNTPLSVTLGQAAWLATGRTPGINTKLGAILGQAQWTANGSPPLTDTKLGQTLGRAVWSATGRSLSGLGAAAAILGLFPVKGSKENLRSGSKRGGTDAT